MWSGIDRRKFPRASYGCRIAIKRKDSSKAISTQTENIGAGGICVLIKEDLGLFQAVDLEITLDDSNEPIRCSGTVVWVVKKSSPKKGADIKYDTGIEFVELSDAQRERVLTAVENILKKGYPPA